MKFLVKCQFVLAGVLVVVLAGCNQNPQEIKEKAAKATREVKQDVKAAANGVKEGLEGKKDDKAPKK